MSAVDRMREIAERLGIRFRVRGGRLQVSSAEDEARLRKAMEEPKRDRWAESDRRLETFVPLDPSNYRRLDVWPSEWLRRR